MSQNYIIDSQYLKDIADAIRKKSKTNRKYTVKEMPAAILGLNTPETADVEDTLKLKLHGKMKFNFSEEVAGGFLNPVNYIKLSSAVNANDIPAYIFAIENVGLSAAWHCKLKFKLNAFPSSNSQIATLFGSRYGCYWSNGDDRVFSIGFCGTGVAPNILRTRNVAAGGSLSDYTISDDELGKIIEVDSPLRNNSSIQEGIAFFGCPTSKVDREGGETNSIGVGGHYSQINFTTTSASGITPIDLQLYECTIYVFETGDVLYNFIPQTQTSTDEETGEEVTHLGMYDTVNEIFYPCNNDEYFEIGQDLIPV